MDFSFIILWSKDKDWLNNGEINVASREDPELKKEVRITFTVTDHATISRIGLLTTRRLKMNNIMVLVMLAKRFWTMKIEKLTSDDNLRKLMNVELLENVGSSFVKIVQLKSFGKGYKCKLSELKSIN